MNPLTEELYTVREASALTRRAYWTIWNDLKTGRLMRTKVGGKTMIRRSELEKLIVDVPKPREKVGAGKEVARALAEGSLIRTAMRGPVN